MHVICVTKGLLGYVEENVQKGSFITQYETNERFMNSKKFHIFTHKLIKQSFMWILRIDHLDLRENHIIEKLLLV